MRAIVIVGLQGVGKSTYCKKLEAEDPTVKRVTKDDIRFMMFDLNTYSGETFVGLHERFGDKLEEIYWTLVDVILKQGLTVILDETHHTKAKRKAVLKRLKDTYPGITVEAHYLYRDFQTCWERNIKRRKEQVVSKKVMRTFLEELVFSFGGSCQPYKAGAKLGWEFFDVIRLIYP